MKRYLVFFGSVYYPNGGMEDFKGDYKTLDEAVSRMEKLSKNTHYWAYIYDTKTRSKIKKKQTA